MIGQLRGKLLEKQPPHLMIEVQGIGYCLQASLSTFFALPEIGAEVTVSSHMIVREDAQLLYGFASKEECRLFQELIKVNGVGPKVALAILSGLSPAEFVSVVSMQEMGRLQKLPGIGAKTAQRILVEMTDRLPKLGIGSQERVNTGVAHHNGTGLVAPSAVEEAISALVSLGYKSQEAIKAVRKVQNVTQGCEYIIREALQGLARV